MTGFDPAASVIILDVRLEGPLSIAELKMALDTGATYVMISRTTAQKLGIQIESSTGKWI